MILQKELSFASVTTWDSHTYLCVLEVMSPERSDLVLATNVPYSETDILKFYCLHIETCIVERKGIYTLIYYLNTRLNTQSTHQTIKRTTNEFKDNKEQEYIYLLPMVGMVVTISPSFNLYKMVVFPAASSPTTGK